jgi:hypothetical protein
MGEHPRQLVDVCAKVLRIYLGERRNTPDDGPVLNGQMVEPDPTILLREV